MYFQQQQNHILIYVYAKPNAKKSQIIGVTEQGINIALKAKPQDGAANKALIRYLAKYFNIPQRDIVLMKGESSKFKKLKLPLSDEILTLLEAMQ